MSFSAFTKKAFATVGRNKTISRITASGKSYFRWSATGAALGAIKSGASNVLDLDPEGKGSFLKSVKYGALSGAGSRMLAGRFMSKGTGPARARTGGR